MAKVYKTYITTKTNFINVMNNITCPLVSITQEDDYMYVLVDNTVTINLHLQSGNISPITITYKGSTTSSIASGYYRNAYMILGYNENVFYMQYNDMDATTRGRAFFFLYEKIGDDAYFGYTGTTSMSVVFYDITSLTMNKVLDDTQYAHTHIFTYDAGLNRIDYSPHDVLCQGQIMVVDDPNFVACTTVTSNQVCSFNGHNYFAVGTRNLLLMDD